MSTLRDAMSHAALGWVKPELDETLRQVRSEVEYFVEDPSDTSRMRFCAGYLHQVQGTLRMVELYAPAMVAEELELLAKAVQDGAVSSRDEACATLMRGAVLLPDYLERLQNGHRDIPIVLLPLLNDIRTARGAETITEDVLLAFDPDSRNASAAEIEHARGSLSGRNRELLNTVGGAVKEELLRIKDALDLHMRTGSSPLQLQTQVNELGAVADTLGVMGLAASRDVVAEQRDALRKVVDRNENIDDSLLLEIAGALLYVDASLDEQVAHLGAKVDGQDDRAGLETRRTIEVLAHEAIANFATAREAFVAFIETNWDHARLTDVPRLLDEVAGALRILDLAEPADYLQGVRQYIQVELIGRQRVPNGRNLDTLADAMASLEYYLEAMRDRNAVRPEILDITRSSLEALHYWPLPVAGDEAAPEPVVAPATPAAEMAPDSGLEAPFAAALADQTETAVAGSPPPLPPAFVFEATTAVPLSALAGQESVEQAPLEQADQTSLQALSFDPVAAEFGLSDSGEAEPVAPVAIEGQWEPQPVDTTEAPFAFDPVAAEPVGETGSAPVEFTFDSSLLEGAAGVDLADDLAGTGFTLDTAAGDMPEVPEVRWDSQMHAAPEAAQNGDADPLHTGSVEAAAGDDNQSAEAAQPVTPEVADFMAQLDAAAAAFNVSAPAAPVPAEPAQEPAAPVAVSNGTYAGFESQGEEIDQEIREVFIEEFDEELENLATLLPVWRMAPDNTERLRPVRRVFHTLKGSGRLVGARVLGEFAWKIESMLNRVLDGSRPASAAVVAMVQQAVDVLPQFNAALRDDGYVTADIEGITEVADRIAAGEDAFYTPATELVESAPAATIIGDAAALPLEGTPASIDEVLREILEAEVTQHLQTVREWVADSRPVPQPVMDELLRAVHTMNGAFAMTDVPEITQVTSAAEAYVKRSLAASITPTDEGVSALAEMIIAVESTIIALRAENPRIPSFASLAATLGALVQTLPEAQWPPAVEALDAADEEPALGVSFDAADVVVPQAGTEASFAAPEHSGADDLSAYFDPGLLADHGLPTVDDVAGLARLDDDVPAEARLQVEDQLQAVLEASDVAGEAAGAGSEPDISVASAGDPGVEAEEAVEPADVVEPAEHAQAAELVEATELAQAAEFAEAAEIAEAVDVVEVAEDLEATATAEATELLEPVALAEAAPTVEAEPGSEADATFGAVETLEAEAVVEAEHASDAEEAIEEQSAAQTSGTPELGHAAQAFVPDQAIEVAGAVEAGHASEDTAAAEAEQDGVSAGTIEAEEAVESAETVEAEEAVESAETVEAEEAVESAETVEAEEAVESAETVEAEEAVESAETVEAEETVESAGTIEAEESIESVMAVEAEAAADVAEPFAIDESVEIDGPVASEPGLEGGEENEAVDAVDVVQTVAAAEAVDGHEADDVPAAAGSEQAAPLVHTVMATRAVTSPVVVGELDFSDLDQELVDIFVEEGKDLLDECDALVSKLRDEPDDREALAGLQRELHTLKGGARMAGINAIGDLGHAIESLLEVVAANRTKLNRADVQLLERGFDHLHQLLTQTQAHRAVAMPHELIEAFDARAHGRAVRETGIAAVDAVPVATQPAEPAAAPVAPPVATVAPPAPIDPAFLAAAEPLSAAIAEEVEGEDESGSRPAEQVRVRADLLDRLVNHAGEVAIYRSRLEQQLGAFRSAMAELDRTNARLRDQLRRLDLETEAQIVARYRREQDQNDQAFDPLELDRFSTLQQLSRALNESAADLGGLQGVLDDLSRNYDVLLQQQSRVSSELQDGLMRARMVPFDGLVPRLRRVVRQAAQDTGKQVHLTLEGTHGELDRNVLDRMIAPLEHMLRNSVAHGLETPAERLARGKPEEGRITLRLRREGSEIVLEVSDDGAGLNRAAIRQRAEQRGLIDAAVQLSDTELDNLIFASGFSTSEQVSQLAGRGVGMDVVRNEVRQLGGSVDIHSVTGQGVTFALRLPQTLAVTQAVFVQIAETTFAVPVGSVSGIGRIARERYESGDDSYFYNGESYTLYDLGTLVGQAAAKAEGSPQIPLLLVRSGELRAAVAIDQVLGNREIVVKPVGLQIASVPGIYGATITGEGYVVVILDVAPLVRRHLSQPQQPVQAVTATVQRHVPVVMVVDDSLTMRKVTGRVLERHNFEVVVARDGVEALERLEEGVPDLMLLDIEMPRMDGYELATAMRADPRYKDVPIVMITSRSGDKHRQRAFEIGVQRYLGKPYQELDLMRNVYDLLGIARVRE